jgi:hypothetical protein
MNLAAICDIVDNMLAIPDNMKNTNCLIDLGLHLFDKDVVNTDSTLRLHVLLKNESETEIRARFRVNIIGKRILGIDENNVLLLYHTSYADLLENIHNKIIMSKVDSIDALESYTRILNAISGVCTREIKDEECTLSNVKTQLIKLICASHNILEKNNKVDIFNKYIGPYSSHEKF